VFLVYTAKNCDDKLLNSRVIDVLRILPKEHLKMLIRPIWLALSCDASYVIFSLNEWHADVAEGHDALNLSRTRINDKVNRLSRQQCRHEASLNQEAWRE
jgi:hypothetical protein